LIRPIAEQMLNRVQVLLPVRLYTAYAGLIQDAMSRKLTLG
jgi:hypothetical protein